MANKIKIAFALPCQDEIKARTAFCLFNAAITTKCDKEMIMRMGCDIVGSRTWLVKEAIKRGCTHLLFVDHDMYFAPDTIVKLLAQDKDIIGAAYNFRTMERKSTAFPLTDITPTDGTFKVKGLGAGLLLIKLSVFEKIPEPWFQFGRDEHGELTYGEDSWFCQQAIRTGYDVWADASLGVKHLGEYKY